MRCGTQIRRIEYDFLDFEDVFDEPGVEQGSETRRRRLQAGADLVANPAKLLCGNLGVTGNGIKLREVAPDGARVVANEAGEIDPAAQSRCLASGGASTTVH